VATTVLHHLSGTPTPVTETPLPGTQDGRLFARARLPWPTTPGGVFRVPFSLVAAADPTGAPVHLTLE
jgi:hypothetical protein